MVRGCRKWSASKCGSEMNAGSKGNRPLHAGHKALKKTPEYLLTIMNIARMLYQVYLY